MGKVRKEAVTRLVLVCDFGNQAQLITTHTKDELESMIRNANKTGLLTVDIVDANEQVEDSAAHILMNKVQFFHIIVMNKSPIQVVDTPILNPSGQRVN